MTQFNKIFVTGAGGLIGSAVCRELSAREIPIVALLKDGESDENVSNNPNIEIVVGDIRNKTLLTKSMASCDACIHLAALNKPWHRPSRDYHDINYIGTMNACDSAMSNELVKFIYISSCEVMGQLGQGEIGSEARKTKISAAKGLYASSKFRAEEHVHMMTKCGLPAVVVRPTAVIGPGDIHLTPPGNFIRSYLSGQLKVYYDAKINIVDSRDVAKVCVDALEAKNGETFIAGSHNTSLADVLKLISETAGVKTKPRKLGYYSAYLGAVALNLQSSITGRNPEITPEDLSIIKTPWFFDSGKAKKVLGMTSRPLAHTINDAVLWHGRKLWKD